MSETDTPSPPPLPVAEAPPVESPPAAAEVVAYESTPRRRSIAGLVLSTIAVVLLFAIWLILVGVMVLPTIVAK